jgi:hypothetical protein
MTIEHPAITALRNAYDTNLKVGVVFKYNLNKPNSALEAYCKYADQFYNGVFIDDKFTNKFKDSLRISNDYFSFYYKSKKAYMLIAQALVCYVKTHSEPYPIDHFMVHPVFSTSIFLMLAKVIHEDYIHTEVYELLNISTKKAMKDMENNGMIFGNIIKLYAWYKDNNEKIKNSNRGAWEVSPLTTFDGFIKECIIYSCDNNGASLHIGNIHWYKFMDFLSTTYSLNCQDILDTYITYDVDYTHQTVKSPLGFIHVGGK